LEETIGAKFNLVTGYKGGNKSDSVERGEIQCRAFSFLAFFSPRAVSHLAEDQFVRAIIQLGAKRDSRLTDADAQ
jgi:hypothetical protein